MKITIRPYQPSDYEMICDWWKVYGLCGPKNGMMITDGTFVGEMDGNPIITLTALKTQSPHISFLEGFCARPNLIKSIRNLASEMIFHHACEYLMEAGFDHVNILSDHSKLIKRYQELGMEVQCSEITTLGKELICPG